MKLETNIDTSISLVRINATQTRIKGALRGLIEPIALTILSYSKEAITTGLTRAIKTGRLRESIFAKTSGLQGIVAPNTNYSFFVHEGTKYMKARPFMERGIELAIPKLVDIANNKFTSEVS